MNKKIIFTIIVVLLVTIYILWEQHQERLGEQRQREHAQRVAQEWTPYIACMDAVEEKYRSNLKDLNLAGLSREKIDKKLAQYQTQDDQQRHECWEQYPDAAIERFSQEILKQRNELRSRNYVPK